MTRVWDTDLPDSEKIVLLALADCANDEGHCWPSMATLAKKCSKGERTVQGAVKALVEAGHLTRREVPGKGCNYTVHPRNDCAPKPPQGLRPRREQQEPPQGLRATPAAAADKPSKNHKKPSVREKARAKHFLPADWKPAEFGPKTQSRKIVDGWPPGHFEVQLEHFRAHHAKKGDAFSDWQSAWSTWVLNSLKFGNRNYGTGQPTSDDRIYSPGLRAAAAFVDRNRGSSDDVGGLFETAGTPR